MLRAPRRGSAQGFSPEDLGTPLAGRRLSLPPPPNPLGSPLRLSCPSQAAPRGGGLALGPCFRTAVCPWAVLCGPCSLSKMCSIRKAQRTAAQGPAPGEERQFLGGSGCWPWGREGWRERPQAPGV